MQIPDKIKMMLDIYREKKAKADESNDHANGLRYEGALIVLEALEIYMKES